MDNLVTPLAKVRTGEMVTTHLHRKLAEVWLGGPLPSLNVWDMSQGNILEEYARPAFTLETGLDVRQVGFITDDAERVGCSPDGLIGENCGLEIKCPRLETHLGYILAGALPKDYIAQVQASLYVTGFSKWFFFSFCRRMPPLILEVYPDPAMQEAISEAVAGFLKRLDEALAKLTALNGGVRPTARAKFAPVPPQDDPEIENLN